MRFLPKIFLSFFLSLTLLAPAIINVITMDPDAIVVSNILEEENKNTIQFDVDEKKVVLDIYKWLHGFQHTLKGKNNPHYQEACSFYTATIHLPPPEFIS